MCKPRVPGLDGVLRQPGLGVAPGLIHMELWMCLVWVRVSVCVSVRVCVCAGHNYLGKSSLQIR
jgi:hypothetical protein